MSAVTQGEIRPGEMDIIRDVEHLASIRLLHLAIYSREFTTFLKNENVSM